MVNINLKTEDIVVEKKYIFKKELVVLGTVLGLLIIMYAGMLIAKTIFDKKAIVASEEYGRKLAEFREGPAKEVFNFQNRLNKAQELTKKTDKTLEILQKLETLIIPDVYLESFLYERDKNQVTLGMVAKNYANIAQQVLSFKKSGYFSNVIVSKSEMDSKIGIKFPLNLIIK